MEWVFTMANDIPVFVDTVSEFKAHRIAHGWADPHPQTHAASSRSSGASL
jgi:hypothetical protein